ncbi:MAG: hypothetical protein IH623_27730 [Verrucomicrobia bacterium]|nr:hypothetical protein [Verrucomicrobiota bacterium]
MKSKPIEYHPAARLEMAEALEWYEWHEAGVGARFLFKLTETEKFVSRQPALGTPHRSGTRKRRMHIFSYNRKARHDLDSRGRPLRAEAELLAETFA